MSRGCHVVGSGMRTAMAHCYHDADFSTSRGSSITWATCTYRMSVNNGAQHISHSYTALPFRPGFTRHSPEGRPEAPSSPIQNGMSKRRMSAPRLPASRSTDCCSPLGPLPSPGTRGIGQRGKPGYSKSLVLGLCSRCAALKYRLFFLYSKIGVATIPSSLYSRHSTNKFSAEY